MTIRFNKSEFERALPVDTITKKPLWTAVGFVKGEEVYEIKVTQNVFVEIRSSIGESGFAKSEGEDSIRCSLLYRNHTRTTPLGKATRTNRTEGWDTRLKDKLRELYAEGFAVKTCKVCGGMLSLRKGKHGDFYGCSNYPACTHTEPAKEPEMEPEELDEELVEELVEDFDFDDLVDEIISEEIHPVGKPFVPNAQQLAYITAPPNANIRVLAAPGSGKTASTVERILFLIENGVNPNSIVYVTYTKSMATEGYERIVRRMPSIEGTRLSTQVCTIHAFCFRILRGEGDRRQKAKEWQVKNLIEEQVSGSKTVQGQFVDYPEKPGWKDVQHWLNLPKVLGVPDSEISDFYRGRLSLSLALKTERIYYEVNRKLRQMNLITFADMLYDVEQRLIKDERFRLRMQSKYTHILVDEAQDINQQALRILMTIAERG